MTTTHALLPLLLLVLAVPAEAGRNNKKNKAPAHTAANTGPTMVPAANLFLRNAFDTDPSVYVGRFVPEGTDGPVDESSAMQLTCSQYIGYRTVGGGGVVYDELFNASSEAAMRVGVPPVLGVEAGGGVSSAVRVRYTLTNKMIAEISDPAAFEACCKQAPDQCTSRYVGEFMEGTGAVYYSTGQGAEMDLGVIANGVAGDLDVKHGVVWQRSVEFPNPVYFAMKTTTNAYAGATAAAQPQAGCGDWVNAPPRSTQGQYFVGVSDPLESERIAREGALLDARTQVVRWVGQAIEAGTVSVQSSSGSVSGLSTMLEQQSTLQAASAGVASLVKDEAWCVQAVGTPAGYRYTAKVLAFLPNAVAEQAAEAVLEVGE
jgi:hypothetical protein